MFLKTIWYLKLKSTNQDQNMKSQYTHYNLISTQGSCLFKSKVQISVGVIFQIKTYQFKNSL